MSELWQVAQMVLETIPLFLLHPFFWLVTLIVFYQYRRITALELKLFGTSVNNVWQQTAHSLAWGAAGGVFASALLLLLGLSLDSLGIEWVWPAAIILLFIHPRLLCFAYAGGIVAIISLTLRRASLFVPSLKNIVPESLLGINLPGLFLLVAVLHLTEALLIYTGGHRGSSPVLIKGPGGKVVGGFSLQRFWPLPLVGLIATVVPRLEASDAGVMMPDWWPLIRPLLQPGDAQALLFYLFPVVAGLGYADLAVSSHPRAKTRFTALNLASYSVLLLLLSFAALSYSTLQLPAAIFAVAGHEFVVRRGQAREFNKPLFPLPPSGVRVLEVVSGSPADRAGYQSGDLIRRVNAVDVSDGQHFNALLQQSYIFARIDLDRDGQSLSIVTKRPPPAAGHYGLILIPSSGSKAYVEMRRLSVTASLRSLANRLRRRRQGK